MERVTSFKHIIGTARDEFVRANAHPFLVLGSHARLERTAFAFRTEATPSPGRADGVYRVVLLGRVKKREDNPFRDRISVGRTSKTDITIADSRISKLHAYFVCDEGAYAITDVGSRNGTRVNDRALVANQPEPIRIGDRLEVGPFSMAFVGPGEVYDLIRPLLMRRVVQDTPPPPDAVEFESWAASSAPPQGPFDAEPRGPGSWRSRGVS